MSYAHAGNLLARKSDTKPDLPEQSRRTAALEDPHFMRMTEDFSPRDRAAIWNLMSTIPVRDFGLLGVYFSRVLDQT